jgi:hypothetical protein
MQPAMAQETNLRLGTMFLTRGGSVASVGGGCDVEGGIVAFSAFLSGVPSGERVLVVTPEFCHRGGVAPYAEIPTAVPAQSTAGFGARVAIDPGSASSAPRIWISAPLEDHSGLSDAGAVYCFERNAAGSWVQIARIVAPDPASGDRFGLAIDVDATMESRRAVIGVPSKSGGGAAYVAGVAGGVGSVTRLSPGALAASARFGHAVAIEGSRIAVGAPDDASLAGRVHFFSGLPTPLSLGFVSGTSSQGLGQCVSLEGGRLVAGAPFAVGTSEFDPGMVYCYNAAPLGSGALPTLIGTVRGPASGANDIDYYGTAVDIEPDGIYIGSLTASDGYQIERVSYGYFNGFDLGQSTRAVLETITMRPYQFAGDRLAADKGLVATSLMNAAGEPERFATNALLDARVRLRDFDGDGVDDLVFAAPTTGRTAMWSFENANDVPARSGTLRVGDAASAPFEYGSSWRCMGVGEVGGGQLAALWKDTATDHAALLESSALFDATSSGITILGVPAFFPEQILAFVDMNGDFTSDIVSRNADGTVGAVMMRDGAVLTVPFAFGGPTASYAGVADIEGNGRASVLLAVGAMRELKVVTYLGSSTLEQPLTDGATIAALRLPANLDIVGAADFDRDGDEDLLVFNKTTRAARIWIMEGPQRVGTRAVGTPLAAGWSIQGVADLDGDWDADIVLRNDATGDIHRWKMNGLTRVGSAFVKRAAPIWKLMTEIEQRR